MTSSIPAPLLHFRTYDPGECTSAGYDIEFFKSKVLDTSLQTSYYAVLTYESKWQGSESGQKYKVHPIPADVADALTRELNNEDHGHSPDLAAAVDTWLELEDPSEPHWKKIRVGVRIR
jgi:hypothetical protein